MKTPVVLQRFAPRAIDATSTGRTINCADAAAVQAALDSAQPGDNIVLQAGVTYSWPYTSGTLRQVMFTCRNIAGAGDTPGSWITIRSSNENLLPPNKRVSPADAPNLAKLLLPNPTWFSSHITMDWYSHHYRFVGLELTILDPLEITNYADSAGGMWSGIVTAPAGMALPAGSGVSPPPDSPGSDALVHHVVMDRCYVHVGDNQLLGVPFRPEGRFITVENCWAGEGKFLGGDSQMVGWNLGTGPIRVVNNHLSGATEGLMNGGSDINANRNYPDPPPPGFIDLFPMDIQDLYCAGNHFVKDWEKTYLASPNWIPLTTDGRWAVVKNSYEYKWQNRAICEANIIEYNWPAGQEGSQTLVTVRSGYTINIYGNGIGSSVGPNGEDWIFVDNCWYRNNIFSHTLQGINFLGCDDGGRFRSHQTKNIVFENNFFYDISGDSIFWNSGRGNTADYVNTFCKFESTKNLKLIHNTVLDTGGIGAIASVPVGFFAPYPPLTGGFGGHWGSQRPEGASCTGFEFLENIVCYAFSTFNASGLVGAADVLSSYAPDAKLLRNGFITPNPSRMQDAVGDGLVHGNSLGAPQTGLPATWVISGSQFATDILTAGFVNADPLWVPGGHRNPADYALTSSSPFYTASSTGGPIGCDMTQLIQAVMGCYTGDWGVQGVPEEPGLGTATLTNISPSSGMQGDTVRVTLTGTDLAGGEIVPFPGVEATIVSTSYDTIVADFKIRHRARPATWPVNVSCDNGPTNALNFTITQAPAPVVTSLSVYQGNTYSVTTVTVTGQNLKWAEITNATGGFVNEPIIPFVVIKHDQFPNVSDTSAVFHFTIPAETVAGPYNLYFTNGGALPAAPVVFTIVAAPPPNPTTITGLSDANPPASGSAITWGVLGQNLLDSSWSIDPPMPGLWVAGYFAPNGNTETGSWRYVIFPVGSDGYYTITLTNDLGGTSNAFPFVVGVPGSVPNPPAVTSISPTSGAAGASVPITIAGTDLTGATISVSGAGVTATGLSATATQITATLVITSGAATGARDVTVTTAGGTSSALTFTITPAATPAPILTSISPSSGQQGSYLSISISGSNLQGASINPILGVTITGVTASASAITANFLISAVATTGAQNVTVTTPGGASNAVSFTVNAPPPPSGGLVLSHVGQMTSIPTGVLGIDGSVNLVGTPAPQYLINGVPIGGGGGGGVASLNGLQGQLSIVAGQNIAVTPLGLGIVIDAAGVTSLAGLQGDVGLVAGSNITITPSGQNITISASGGGGGQPQTPWAQSVDAANFWLSNVGNLGIARAPRAGYVLDIATSSGGFNVTAAGGVSIQGSINVAGVPGTVSTANLTASSASINVGLTMGAAGQTLTTRISWITDAANWRMEVGGSAANQGKFQIFNEGYVNVDLGGSGPNPTIALPHLRTTDPGAGSKELWCDTTDGNRVKFAP